MIENTANNIFIVNGFFDSNKSNYTEDIILENSSNLEKLDYLKSFLGTIAKNEENEMIALNSSIMIDPVFISIKNQKKENAINIFIITTDQKKEFSSSPRLFIEASKNTISNINEIYIDLSSDELQNLTIPVLEYLIDNSSEVNHRRVQLSSENSYFFNFDRILQKENSKLTSVSFSTSGQLSRYDIHSDLIGINSECTFHGLYKNQF